LVRRVTTNWRLTCGMLPSNADIRAAPNADIRVKIGTTRHQIGVLDTSRFG
jgi:hypothetical protein